MMELEMVAQMPFSSMQLTVAAVIIAAGVISLALTILQAHSIKRLAQHIFSPRSIGNVPPGSLGLPLLGESLQFISSYRSQKSPDTFIQHRQSRYGSIFTTHLFGKPTVVSLDAEVNRFILNSDGRLFVPDYPTSLKELWGKGALLMLEGNIHKRVHGVVAAQLRSQDLKEHLLHHMEAFILGTMESWNHSISDIVYLQEEIKKISFHVTAKALLGLDPGPTTSALRSEFHKYIAGVVSVPVKIPGTTFHRSIQSRRRMVEMIEDIIRAREKMAMVGGAVGSAERSSSCGLDMLDVLIRAREEEPELPWEVIMDNIVSFFFPSEDSIAMLITLAVKYISECPLALHQLREENMDLLERHRGEQLSWKHYLTQLPFTDQVLSETLRLGNIVKGVIRKALVDVHIKGFVIPKGWNVFPFFRGVHLSEAYYPDAHEFNPWRWQEKVPLSLYTPFGGGPRYCSGIEISRLEAIVFLHHLVTKYEWDLAERDMVVNFPFVKLAKGLPIKIRRRPPAI